MRSSIKAYLPFLFLVLIACNEGKKKEISKSSQPKSIEAKGYVVPKDSIAEPQVIAVDETKLKKIPAGKPKIVPTNMNVHKVGTPMVVMVDESKLRKITPGTDTFTLPKVVPVIDRPIIARQPKPVQTLTPRMKDEANCNIQYLDVDQGMNSSYIIAMLEDKSGNLWFATWGSGVSRYDGRSFLHYTESQGLSSSKVLSTLKDKAGNLWFGTDGGGVSKYDGKSFTHYTEKEGLNNNTVASILEDRSGNIWIGTRKGVSKYDGKFFTHYSKKQGLSSNIIMSILEDQSGNLWFGTLGGVNKYDGKSFTHYTEKDGLAGNYVSSVLEDQFGTLWFGTNGGITKYDGKSFTNYTEREGLSNNYIRRMMEDRSGNLWFCTNGGGVCKYDGNRVEAIERGDNIPPRDKQDLKRENGKLVKCFTHYGDKEGLSNNDVLSILEDESGNFWLGTNGGGVCKYNSKSFKNYTEKEGLSKNVVMSMLKDQSGNLWFGTILGGVCKYDGDSFANYTEKEGLSSNIVWSMMKDKSGNLWFGSNGNGVLKFDGKSFTHFTKQEGLCSNTIYAMIEDRSGNLWFGSWGDGVSKYDGKSFTHYTAKEGLIDNSVVSMREDKSGNIWFGTNGGLTKYDGKTFTHYTEEGGLSKNSVYSIFEDRAGSLWFGTWGGGVSKFNGKTFTHYTEKEGLSNDIVSSILEDDSGNLWLGTEKGLNCLVRDDKVGHNKDQVVKFHKEEGLKAGNFFQNSVLMDSKNQIWWGTGKALTMLDLNKFKVNEKEPTIQLDNIYLQENFVDYRGLKQSIQDTLHTENEFNQIKFNDVAEFHNYPKELELPFDINHLTFNFSAIDWSAPNNLKYQYKLEGWDEDWSQLTTENKADYRNIPFGKYTFQVKAIGIANRWSKVIEYPFVIHPPWWRTWWMHTIYAAFAIAAMVFIVRWNGRRLRLRANELKQKVDEATVEIRQQKEVVEEQKQMIEEKHKEITDSIRYAQRIQNSLLPTEKYIDKAIERSKKKD